MNFFDFMKPRRTVITVLPMFGCNLRCRMCYNWTIKEEKVLREQDWRDAILNYKQGSREKVHVSIGGGEPFLSHSTLEIAKACKKKGFHCTVSTNGSLLSPEMVKDCVEAGVRGINLSLDSMKEETHDRFRGIPGSFRNVMGCLEALEATDMEISVNSVLMKDTVDDVLDVALWVESKPSIAFNVQAISEPFQKKQEERWWEKSSLFPDRQGANKAIDGLVAVKKRLGSRMNNTLGQLEAYRRYFSSPDDFIKHRGCSLTDLSALTVNPDGSVFICPYMEPAGNIKDAGINKIANSAGRLVSRMKKCEKNCHHLMNCYYKDEQD